MKASVRIALTAALASTFVAMTACAENGSKKQAASELSVVSNVTMPKEAVAVFAGGCFWCVESDFEKLTGVNEVVSGYTGGRVENPTYSEVSSGTTGHIEAVEVYYDPSVISYDQLLQSFWRQIDPTDNGGQFVDRGYQYRPAIFVKNTDERRTAENSKAELSASGRYDKSLQVEILPVEKFYRAEDYHQDYYKKNPIRYKFYRYNSGRDQYLEKAWGDELAYNPAKSDRKMADSATRAAMLKEKKYMKPSDEELKQSLSPLQYKVTQEEGTERAFDNIYWNEKRAGIYVDIVSGEPLFSSLDKYDSGTGWPSFSKPLDGENIVEKQDYKLILPRTEVRSKHGDSHLGHVFDDGPAPTGLRYCINSAALKFIPVEALAQEGYEQYVGLFSK